MKRVKVLFLLFFLLPTFVLKQSSISAQTPSQTGIFNMSYLFFGTPNSYISQVDRTKGSLHVVSPNYFDISQNGTLDITWTLQSAFIDEMHRRGIKVVPFLANHWNLTAGKSGLNNREQLARSVADAIETFNLDGVNVDIEGVGRDYRAAHTDFIRLLRQYIPAHKEVSVAVAANPNGWNTGWHGFYDYKGLSEHANHLMIMAYDESWESPDSPIGPVSSISFFERSIKYAIDQGVPNEKVVVGLPFYGRIWKLDGPTLEGVQLTGRGISSTRVQPFINQFNGSVTFDEKTQSAKATFTIPKGQSAFLGGTKLTEGNYLIWYDNEQAIRAKLRLPKQYGIKGTGSWALYHETPETWTYYTSALNWDNGSAMEIVTRFGSGPMAITTTDVNMRSSASINGSVLRKLTKGMTIKVSGEPVSATNYNWYPVTLLDGTEGFVASNYLKQFQLQELYGKSRYETSVLVSNSGWEENSEAVVLGRGDIPIDALTGSVLATKYNSPLLLTGSNNLSEEVLTEIEKLSPKTIFLLGGEQAISRSIHDSLVKKGYKVSRIAGKSRYDTAVKVSEAVGTSNEVILTTGLESPDALAVAPYAGLKQIPILLTKPTTLPADFKTVISNKKITKVTIVGGEGAVSKNIEDELRALGVQNVERVSGKNRYDTSVAIAQRYRDALDFPSLFFTSGVSYIDALPGSPLAAKHKAPIILVNNGTLPSSVTTFLQNDLTETPNINIIGGYGVISATTRANVLQSLK